MSGTFCFSVPLSELYYSRTDSHPGVYAAGLLPSANLYPPVERRTVFDKDNDLVNQWLMHFTKEENRAWVQAIIDRSAHYTLYIREEVLVRNLPMELIYLPGIESGFKSTAVSKSGAAGLWQFMLNSISPYGMTVSSEIDERLDLVKSTKGALEKLTLNYRTLGDWLLAVAAYNCGLGCMERTITAAGSRDFWDIRHLLPKETQNYIPKFLAFARIGMYPERYGYSSTKALPVTWSFIAYDKTINLRILSERTQIPLSRLRFWHPELRNDISPLTNGTFMLKVPSHYSDIVIRTVNSPDFSGMEYFVKTIERGDTLFSIAQASGTTVSQLLEHNPSLKPESLTVGGTVLIPKHSGFKPPESRLSYETLKEYSYYVVLPGDTLWNIAKKYETYPEYLAYWNDISLLHTIQPGQLLKVPLPGRTE